MCTCVRALVFEFYVTIEFVHWSIDFRVIFSIDILEHYVLVHDNSVEAEHLERRTFHVEKIVDSLQIPNIFLDLQLQSFNRSLRRLESFCLFECLLLLDRFGIREKFLLSKFFSVKYLCLVFVFE